MKPAILSLGIFLLLTLNANSNEQNHFYEEQTIVHLVLFKFRSNITLLEKKEVINQFMALKSSLKYGKPYLTIEYGFQNSKENIKGDYDIGFTVTFASVEDRDYYVGKPFLSEPRTFDQMHDDFKNFVDPYLAAASDNPNKDVLVFDFKSNEKESMNHPRAVYRLDHWLLFKSSRESVKQRKKSSLIGC